MKKLIIKTSYFTLPFLLFYLLNISFYNPNEGGLVRTGYLYGNVSPMHNISNRFVLRKKNVQLSEISLINKNNFQVVTIGDSFSDQDSLGYKNFLANDDVSVLDVDRFIVGNPIQRIIELINGDFFDTIKTSYIVLQSVEREFVQRCLEVNFNKSISVDSLSRLVSKHTKKEIKHTIGFFSDATFKIPYTNVEYLFKSKPTFSKTYKVASNSNTLFSNNPDILLFYEDDVNYLNHKNDSVKIAQSNNVINKISSMLSQKGIQLILLISPDKYDLYYPYIRNKEHFTQSLFFPYFNPLNKDYSYINTFELLSQKIKNDKDVYYFDDTHWTPYTADIVAKEIKVLLNK